MRHKHLVDLERLLATEARVEAEQFAARARRPAGAAAEAGGQVLTDLVIRDAVAALGGRVLLTLAKRNQSLAFPWNRLGSGSPVLLIPEGEHDGKAQRGVVTARSAGQLEVACEELPQSEADRPTWRVELAGDEIARARQRGALQAAGAAQHGRLAQLRDVLLGEREPAFDALKPAEPLDSGLNASQRAAVDFALAARDVAIIHGPPGTGKTTTVVELVRRAVARGERVLACAASNLAVDNLLERLLAAGVRAVRLGHPARVLPELRAHTLDLLVDADPDLRVARRLVRDAHALRDRAARFTRAKPQPGERQQMRREARDLLADARAIEDRVVRHLLDSAEVIGATLTGLDPRMLGDRTFDLAVIDEAAQAVEPSSWIPLARCGRLVLAGDHCQLPPTVVSPAAAREGLATSLPERLLALHGAVLARRLDVQYRMHADIMGFSSAEFYDGSLAADPSVARRLLADLDGVIAGELTRQPVEFIDTAGAGYDEEPEPGGESRRNPQEARLVCRKVGELLAAGVSAAEIGVITPYSAQVRLLDELLAAEGAGGIEVDSVDGFQGREKEAIVISLVRSNPQGEIGFLADTRRMNVALTRARRKLLVVGDSATVAGHPFYRRWLEYCEACGRYGSVWEEC